MIDNNKRMKTCDNSAEDVKNGLDAREKYGNNLQRRDVSICFLCISNINDGVLICIHKEDDEKDVEAGLDKYARSIAENRKVLLYNYKDNTYKKWNPISTLESEGVIPLVDYDSLIDVIRDIQNSRNEQYMRKDGLLKRFYFAVIYKLLKDGIFGIKNNDMSLRDFVDKMAISGLDAGKKTNLGEHYNKLEGKSPIISMKQNEPKSVSLINDKIKLFIEEIVSRYLKKVINHSILDR